LDQHFDKFSYLKSANADYIDELFARYCSDPDSVEPTWRYFFEGLELGAEAPAEPLANGHAPPNAPNANDTKPAAAPEGRASIAPEGRAGIDLSSEAKVAELITAYRELGHMLASIDPLHPAPTSHPLLELTKFGLSPADLERTFTAGRLLGMGPAKLSDIIARLRETYCGSIGVEFTHIQDPAEHRWLQERMESSRNREELSAETRKKIHWRLAESETFERFLHTRYVAQKRFSVEGGETLIPSLDRIIDAGAELGAREFVLGMAHRGRLNVLTHIFGKKPEYIFTEFEGAYKADTSLGEGDVKYHMGFSADVTTSGGKSVHLSLASNPSHLEVINPVVEGVARAKQTYLGDSERRQVIPILIHGDAAFAGQGVCYETLNLSQLEGYATGGTLHIVINNQVGFTTDPKDARSTTYSTDLAKMLEVPIFHVNGDDPEAAWYVAGLCTEYRQKFRKDVFIELICYRKHGHNEGDEPTFTQPVLYKAIKAHASTRELYAAKLDRMGVLPAADSQAAVEQITAKLVEAQARTKAEAPQPYVSVFQNKWQGLKRGVDGDMFKPVDTAVAAKTLVEIAEKINAVPSGFHLHPKLTRFLELRLKAVKDGEGIDWGGGEALAFGSLLVENHPVRLSGQDAERGTFTHRHSVLNDFETGEKYAPLNHIRASQARYSVHNSHLSETGVMGFEYGFSLADPGTLVIWEAQFGDFANGAQIIIDQFLSSSESKWQRMSGLTLLLPHGFEGQGPEHSSARLERFLTLSGKNNMSVCNFTTPAQLFHALRRQVLRDFRKPMVVMSPKSLLRHPHAVSRLEDFTKGRFQEVLDDPAASPTAKKVLLCTGKVYYDLLAEREKQKREKDVALIRVEQLHPWPSDALAKCLSRYTGVKSFTWVQEEPRNMGAWPFVFGTWMGGLDEFAKQVGGRPVQYVGREIGAAPAVGSLKVHTKEQQHLVEKAFEL
jgi:2-oxoglutarate dehydrogenase E1 component